MEEGDDGHNYLGPIFDAPYDPMPARLQRAWDLAWERLDADLDRPQEDYYVQQDPREHRISRRRAVAAAQTGLGPNAFDGAGWTIPSARPRMTFPHLQPEISKEESDSWKMMELAEKIEAKRRRSSLGSDDMLAPMGVDMKSDSDGRKFKRPRTKRDSQLAPINTQFTTTITTSSSNNIVTEAEASSPPSGGLFTSILEGIGRFQEVPIVSAADVSGRDLGRMWPISPDCSSTTSAMSTFSRSRSPPAMYPPGSTPTSPPTSRPTSPAGERGRRLYPNSPTRTPIGSPERGGRRKPWDAAPSPPASRMQSPSDMRPSRRQHSRSGESSASDSDTRRGRATRENKAEIVKMVSAALKPLYPARIDKEAYTEINKRISRQMYKFVGEVGVTDREAWREAIDKEVKREVERSAGGDM